MSLLADALQPFIVRELISISGRVAHMTLPDLLVGTGVGYVPAFDSADQSVLISFNAPDLVTTAWAADCCRLASALYQTVSSLADDIDQRDNVAWCMIRLYYSAFYAGHALIRLLGEGCSFLERQHLDRLRNLGVAIGSPPVFSLASGLYRCSLEQNATALKYTRAQTGARAAHEAFWEVFGIFIRGIAERLLQGSMLRYDAQTVFSKLDQFMNALNRKANHGWLSFVRNDLQYRHRYNVWFPAQLRQKQRHVLRGLIDQWRRDPMEIDLPGRRDDDLKDFAVCCVFVVALCHTMLQRIADRSTVGPRSFVRVGPLAFLNDVRPRSG